MTLPRLWLHQNKTRLRSTRWAPEAPAAPPRPKFLPLAADVVDVVATLAVGGGPPLRSSKRLLIRFSLA